MMLEKLRYPRSTNDDDPIIRTLPPDDVDEGESHDSIAHPVGDIDTDIQPLSLSFSFASMASTNRDDA